MYWRESWSVWLIMVLRVLEQQYKTNTRTWQALRDKLVGKYYTSARLHDERTTKNQINHKKLINHHTPLSPRPKWRHNQLGNAIIRYKVWVCRAGVGQIEGSGSQHRVHEPLGSSGGLGVGERDYGVFFSFSRIYLLILLNITFPFLSLFVTLFHLSYTTDKYGKVAVAREYIIA